MTRRILSFLVLVGFFAVAFGQACSEIGGVQDNSFASSIDAAGFTLSPASANVAVGGTVQFVPVGGVAPFTWTINNGNGGTVTQNGLFTAPSQGSANGSIITIQCTDSLGTQEFASVSVGTGGMIPTFSPNPAAPGTLITIQVSGGRPPYTAQQSAGSGQLSNMTYMAPSTPEIAAFLVTDSGGATATLSIPIGTGGSPQTGILNLSMSTPGSHIPNGPGCPMGYTLSGMIADGSYDFTKSAPNIYGDIDFCMQTGSIGAGQPYVTDMFLGQSCPAGFQQVAAYPICTTICWGSMVLCAKFSTGGVNPVRDFYITQENIHNPSGPYCNAGYTSIGMTTDCGFANCSGLQNFCVLK